MRCLVIAIASLVATCLVQTADGQTQSTVLYQTQAGPAGRLAWKDSTYGRIVEFQRALDVALGSQGPRVTANGEFGPQTRAGIRALLARPSYRDIAAAGENGEAITVDLWQRLLPGVQPPSLRERTMTLVLTYEATPYDRPPEWNFCQSRRSNRRVEQPCLTNDPNSFLTWGPRGATAGGGREIQAVVVEVDRLQPDLIDAAFGIRAAEVRRFVGLAGRATPGESDMRRQDTERYLCGVWFDPARAEDWRQGFLRLASNALVRRTYENIYAAANFDGGKITAFYRLYSELGRTPTEVDYAFIVERATHTNGVFAAEARTNSGAAITKVAAQVRAALPGAANAPAWQVRRALANILVPGNQQQDRNGRDVVFFVDGATPAGLSSSELANWSKRGARFASGVGLSDDRPAQAHTAEGTFPNRSSPTALTAEESAQCPVWVLNWRNPGNGTQRRPQAPD
jgi:hypothetical protein